jgi:signal transduction histidine kinase
VVAAYFVVSEALANVAKHARASTAEVIASADAGRLRITVRDDGAGGAVPGTGSGLVGLKDRVEALGGTMEIDSPPGRGTEIHAELPLAVRCPDSLID